jgi:hypothetical protein
MNGVPMYQAQFVKSCSRLLSGSKDFACASASPAGAMNELPTWGADASCVESVIALVAGPSLGTFSGAVVPV